MIYVLLGILIVAEIIIGIEVVRSVNRYCNVNRQRLDEGTNVSDSDLLSDVRCGISSRSGDQSDYLELDDEAVKGILTVMRMSVRYSEAERLAIDYCIDRLEAENG